VTKDGQLCLLDFGLCAEIDIKAREAMTRAIVHLLYRDFDTLIHSDTKELGFLPDDFDTEELKPILAKILAGGLLESGSNLKKRQRKLMEMSNELNEIFFRYPFQVPEFFALVTRGLGLLEGIALVGDPNFDIFRASAPYATKRAASMIREHSFRRMSRSFTGRNASSGIAPI
jgi:predicted unusual protein kinase regulating ubiquinone biosynthesis (AarF/ABC1/UbiB family)